MDLGYSLHNDYYFHSSRTNILYPLSYLIFSMDCKPCARPCSYSAGKLGHKLKFPAHQIESFEDEKNTVFHEEIQLLLKRSACKNPKILLVRAASSASSPSLPFTNRSPSVWKITRVGCSSLPIWTAHPFTHAFLFASAMLFLDFTKRELFLA